MLRCGQSSSLPFKRQPQLEQPRQIIRIGNTTDLQTNFRSTNRRQYKRSDTMTGLDQAFTPKLCNCFTDNGSTHAECPGKAQLRRKFASRLQLSSFDLLSYLISYLLRQVVSALNGLKHVWIVLPFGTTQVAVRLLPSFVAKTMVRGILFVPDLLLWLASVPAGVTATLAQRVSRKW